MLRLNFVGVIHLAPEFRCFGAEFIIIVDCSSPRIALSAIEAAIAYKILVTYKISTTILKQSCLPIAGSTHLTKCQVLFYL